MRVEASSPVQNANDPAPSDHDVVVVGAGLAGLTAGLVVARAGLDVAILDSRRPGGRAAVTTVDPGVVFNGGPRALYRGGPAMRVLTSFGITPLGPVAPTAGSCRRDGAVFPLPDTPLGLLRSPMLSGRGKVRAGQLLASLQRIKAERYDHHTVAAWLEEARLPDDARDLVRSIVRLATYTNADDELAAGVAIRQVQQVLRHGVLYLDGGFQQLVDALSDAFVRAGGSLIADRAVRSIHPADSQRPAESRRWTVRTRSGDLSADAVVVAAGGPDAAESLLPVPLDRRGLGNPAEVACLELALRRPPERRLLLGLDEPYYLSTHTPPADLAPPGITVVHVARYGVRSSAEDRGGLWDHAEAAGIRDDDVVAQRFLHRMVVTGGIPTATGGGVAGRPSVTVAGAPGCFVAGDWVGDDGLLADASFASAERAATSAIAELVELPRPGRVAGSRPAHG